MNETAKQQNDNTEKSLSTIQTAVQKATEQAYADWAAAHPSLAGVIDRMVLQERTTESIRKSPEFRQAVAGFYESQNELDLVNQLMSLAGPVLQKVLGI
jgi:2-oxo-4-hydroxy-4-carboxy--5-ureidoimidazoline (OHCU) decarboxylase